MKDRDPLEKVIRPIVEGQIRGFLKEHPPIVAAVDWFKPRRDKAATFVNSLAKRIILDLLCEVNRDRIEQALFEIWERDSGVEPSLHREARCVGSSSETARDSTVARGTAVDSGLLGTLPEQAGGFHDWFGN